MASSVHLTMVSGSFSSGIAGTAIVERKDSIGEFSHWVGSCKRPVSDQLLYRIIVLHLMGNACGNMHAIPRTQTIGPPFHQHAGRSFDHGHGLAEAMDMVRQRPTGLKRGCSCTKSRCPACPRDKGAEVDARRATCNFLPIARGKDFLSDRVRNFDQVRLR